VAGTGECRDAPGTAANHGIEVVIELDVPTGCRDTSGHLPGKSTHARGYELRNAPFGVIRASQERSSEAAPAHQGVERI